LKSSLPAIPVFSLRLTAAVTALATVTLPLLAQRLPAWRAELVTAAFLVFTALFAGYDWQLRRERRQVFVRHYVQPQSRLKRWLRGGYLMLPVSVLKGALMSLAFFAGVLAGGDTLVLMLAAPPVVYGIRHLVWRSLQGTIVDDWLSLFSEQAARWLALATLLTLYVAAAFYLPQPDYAGADFRTSASRALYSASAQTEFISLIRAVTEFQQFLFAWTVQNLMRETHQPLLLLAGWSSILLKGGVVVLPAIDLALVAQRNIRPLQAWVRRRLAIR